ncbi:hypothetical protein Kpol_1017p2, partial [Vanderwaltozyma polyspora DSM 70294]
HNLPTQCIKMTASSNMDVDLQVTNLMGSLSARTANQYKSYYTKYIKWCHSKGFILDTEDTEFVYKHLPVSSNLFHWFLMDDFITNTDAADSHSTIESSNLDHESVSLKIGTLKKIVSSLKFLAKICSIHKEGTEDVHIDEKYLESIIRSHTYWYNELTAFNNTINMTNTHPAILKVSINLWNPQTLNLSDKIFKTGLEKSRFLVDFHFTNYLHLNYSKRSIIKLFQLNGNKEKNCITLDQYDETSRTHSPLLLLPQSCPFLCPITSLATYLYLRFYGIRNVYKGDGFPDLSNTIKQSKMDYSSVTKLSANLIHWLDLPLIRGKSPLDYPKDETMSNYYSIVFRYCHLPYKRREYFQKTRVEFPTWTDEEFNEFDNILKESMSTAYKYKVPYDFAKILNLKSPFIPYDNVDNSLTNESMLPASLLDQLFPEIDQYKRHSNILSKEAKNFLNLMETLRNALLKNLPWIFHFFPHHDIFKDSLFSNSDFQSYFQEVIGNSVKQNPMNQLPFDILPGINKYTENDIYDVLIEPPLKTTSISSSTLVNLPSIQSGIASNLDTSSIISDEIMGPAFQFVQYQTASNFKLLLTTLSKVFNKLDMKKSSREFLNQQMNSLSNILVEKINSSKPSDVKKIESGNDDEENLKIEELQSKEKEHAKPKPKFGLLDLDSSSSEESEEESDREDINEDNEDDEDRDMQEELKFMVNELVGEKVRATFKIQMSEYEKKLKMSMEKLVEEKISQTLKTQTSTIEGTINDILDKRKRDQDRIEKEEEEERERNRIKKARLEPVSVELPALESNKQREENSLKFIINSDIDTVEGVILEWFTPNAEFNNESIHSMNKKHGKEWRIPFKSLYKERKIIIEFYIFLVNQKQVDRYKAVQICESLRTKKDTKDKSLSSLAHYLKDSKVANNNSFEGILETLSS